MLHCHSIAQCKSWARLPNSIVVTYAFEFDAHPTEDNLLTMFSNLLFSFSNTCFLLKKLFSWLCYRDERPPNLTRSANSSTNRWVPPSNTTRDGPKLKDKNDQIFRKVRGCVCFIFLIDIGSNTILNHQIYFKVYAL